MLCRGTIRATVLIETILASFEMEEILFEVGGQVYKALGISFSVSDPCQQWCYFGQVYKAFIVSAGSYLSLRI